MYGHLGSLCLFVRNYTNSDLSISLDPSAFNLIFIDFCRRSYSTLGMVPLGPLAPRGPLARDGSTNLSAFRPAPMPLLSSSSTVPVSFLSMTNGPTPKHSQPQTAQSLFSLPHRSFCFVPTGSGAQNTNTNTNTDIDALTNM